MRASAQADRAALVSAALVLAHTAPDSRVLPGVDGPAQAFFGSGATTAHLFGFFYLEQGRTAVPDGKEELWVHLTAGGLVTPVHDVNSLSPPVSPVSVVVFASQLVKIFTSYATFIQYGPSYPGLS